MKLEFSRQIFKEHSNIHLIREVELFHVEWLTGIYDEANNRFMQLCESA